MTILFPDPVAGGITMLGCEVQVIMYWTLLSRVLFLFGGDKVSVTLLMVVALLSTLTFGLTGSAAVVATAVEGTNEEAPEVFDSWNTANGIEPASVCVLLDDW